MEYHTGRNSGSRTYTSEKKQGKNRKTAGVIGAFAVVCMLFLVIAAGYKILPYINNSEEKGSYRIISDGYEMLTQTYDGYMRMQMNGKWGYISSDGKKVIDYQYERGRSFTQIGYAAAKQNGKYGYIDEKNHWIIQPEFIQAKACNDHGIAAVESEEGIWKLIQIE